METPENEFEVGFSTVDITPDNLGFPMYGYSARKGKSSGVHDPIFAKTMVLRKGEAAWSLTVMDLLGIEVQTVEAIRRIASNAICNIAAENTGLKPEAMMIACIHTHSSVSPREPENWNRPFDRMIAEGIHAAWQNLKPARVGASAGFLYGYHVNRRWMERPVDPSVNVIRFDDLDGKPIGIAANFGLHPVVMGYDNLLISADYVGVARKVVESEFGCPCLFANGAAGDVNPITANVRRQLAAKSSFVTMTGETYFGRRVDTIELSDRIGGTFEEVDEIGRAVGDRIVYVAGNIATRPPLSAPWSYSARFPHSDEGGETIEAMALGLDDLILVGEPGEVYVETGLDLKTKARQLGYRFPWVVSYANDYQSYLSPEAAFPEGGYEVEMSKRYQHSANLQQRLWDALRAGIPRAVTVQKNQWEGFPYGPAVEKKE